jgi:hypothetical protein
MVWPEIRAGFRLDQGSKKKQPIWSQD